MNNRKQNKVPKMKIYASTNFISGCNDGLHRTVKLRLCREAISGNMTARSQMCFNIGFKNEASKELWK